MGVRFVNVLAQVASAGRRPKAMAASQSLFDQGSRSIEEALRAHEIAGDRIAACLGCVLAVSSVVFLLYAFRTNAPGQVDPLSSAPSVARQGTLVVRIEGKAERGDRSQDRTAGNIAPAAPAALHVMGADSLAETVKAPELPGLGYVLLRVQDGAAIIEGPDGVMTVTPGTIINRAGRVQSIERHATGWVVITSRTIIGASPRQESGNET